MMGIGPLLKGVVIGAAILATATAATAQQKLRPVTIGLSSSSLGPAVPRIAKELGLFEKYGLDAKIVPMESGNTALAALISKTAEGGMIGSGTIIAAQARGQKIVIIANGYAGSATTMVIAKSVADKLGVAPNAPVPDRLKATNGLLIATPEPTAASTISFKGAASSVGANIRFTYMAQSAMQAAMESGAIQGYLASAPFWAGPVANGTGVAWISGPKGELPPEFVNVSSTSLQMLRDTADADPELPKKFAAVFADFRKMLDEKPDAVKAAVAKVFPDLSPKILDVVFPSESVAWNAKPLTAADMAREIQFVKNGGTPIPGTDNIDPKAMIYP
jgi:ABC-type nitrate/sulfonate/bicarbonate transport system substrate-binding protein